jgi:hypothetical protein
MTELYCRRIHPLGDIGTAEQVLESSPLPDGITKVVGQKIAKHHFDGTFEYEPVTTYVTYDGGQVRPVEIGSWVVTTLNGHRSIVSDRDFQSVFAPVPSVLDEIQDAVRSVNRATGGFK